MLLCDVLLWRPSLQLMCWKHLHGCAYYFLAVCVCVLISCQRNIFLLRSAAFIVFRVPVTDHAALPTCRFFCVLRRWCLTVNSTKYFWLFSPTQLFTQGQWWSIFLMQRLHTLDTHTHTKTEIMSVICSKNVQSILPACSVYQGALATSSFKCVFFFFLAKYWR